MGRSSERRRAYSGIHCEYQGEKNQVEHHLATIHEEMAPLRCRACDVGCETRKVLTIHMLSKRHTAKAAGQSEEVLTEETGIDLKVHMTNKSQEEIMRLWEERRQAARGRSDSSSKEEPAPISPVRTPPHLKTPTTSTQASIITSAEPKILKVPDATEAGPSSEITTPSRSAVTTTQKRAVTTPKKRRTKEPVKKMTNKKGKQPKKKKKSSRSPTPSHSSRNGSSSGDTEGFPRPAGGQY